MPLANQTPARQVCRRAEDRLVNTQPPTPSPTRPPRAVSRTPLAFVALAMASVVAAGVGGYVAQSQRQTEMPAVEASPSLAATVSRPANAETSNQPARQVPAAAVIAPVTPEPVPAKPVAPPAPSTTPVEAPRPRDARPAAPALAKPTTARPTPAPAPPAIAARTPEPAPAQPAPASEPAAPVAAVAEPPHPPAAVEPVRPPTRLPEVETFIIPADAVMGLEIERSLSSESARVEDLVEARVTRDVRGDGNVILIPAGTRARGVVTVAESGGKFKERARLGIRFHTLLLGDGQSIPIDTEPLLREGENVGRKTGARIGASAAGGAIIGAIFGGEKGAAIGAAAGAGAGTAASAAAKPSEARFRAGSVVTVRLTAPVSISLEL